MFNLFLSGLSFVFYFVATKFITPPLRKKAIFIGGLMIYFSIYIILFKLTYIHLIFYAVIIGVAYPIINVPYISITYDVIGKARQAKELRFENIIIRIYIVILVCLIWF